MQKLKALVTRLSWQLEALQLQIETLQQQLSGYQEQIGELQKTIENACQTSMHIHPEKEMSRLSFTLKTQSNCEEITRACREGEMELVRLLDRQLRVKTELRLLEKYQHENQEKIRQKNSQQENLAMDEWALQQRKPS